jgi:hypothetical protein
MLIGRELNFSGIGAKQQRNGCFAPPHGLFFTVQLKGHF